MPIKPAAAAIFSYSLVVSCVIPIRTPTRACRSVLRIVFFKARYIRYIGFIILESLHLNYLYDHKARGEKSLIEKLLTATLGYS